MSIVVKKLFSKAGPLRFGAGRPRGRRLLSGAWRRGGCGLGLPAIGDVVGRKVVRFFCLVPRSWSQVEGSVKMAATTGPQPLLVARRLGAGYRGLPSPSHITQDTWPSRPKEAQAAARGTGQRKIAPPPQNEMMGGCVWGVWVGGEGGEGGRGSKHIARVARGARALLCCLYVCILSSACWCGQNATYTHIDHGRVRTNRAR